MRRIGQQLHHPTSLPGQTDTVHVALVHNKQAGSRSHSDDDLVGLLRDFGHSVEVFGKARADILRALRSRPGVLIASGGDGTVAKVAIAACGMDVPIFILPTGTSNNIARAVGAHGTIPTLVERMASARLSRLDVGRIAGDGHEGNFVEAAGTGFIGAMLAEGQRPSVRFASAVRGKLMRGRDHWVSTAERVAEHVRSEPARYYNIVADGRDLSGEYIAVEAMNIASIGPRIRLAPDADPGDGQLELVLAHPDDRDALASYIETRGATADRPPVTIHRVRTVEMDWPSAEAHLDDELWPPDVRDRSLRMTIDIVGFARVLVD
ncbi:MAG TPA: diacylglycerol kinase family protein [Gemmatimonadaceae bacterium]|jgi:diacylglycerol kinase family enzyme